MGSAASAEINPPATGTSASGQQDVQNLRMQVFTRLEDLATLVPGWEQLLADSPDASIFSTWEWLSAWWRAFGDGQKLLVLAFYDSTSRFVGLAPLAVGTKRLAGLRLRVLRLMGDGSGDSDNLDIICQAGLEAIVTNAVFEFIKQLQPKWDVCELNTLPAQSQPAKCMLDGLKASAWPHVTHRRPCLAITLPKSWDSYRQLISPNERYNISRFWRRLENKYRVRCYKCRDRDELTVCLERLFELHQKRWALRGEVGAFRSAERRRFYGDIGRLLLERNRLEFWLLELDGNIVAALFGFRYRDTVYDLQSGFDPDYQRDSVGYILRAQVLNQLIAAGVHRFDFLAGWDPAKTRWGAEVGNYIDIHFARPHSVGSLLLQAADVSKRAKEWLRAHLPQRAWALLHRVNVSIRASLPKTSVPALSPEDV
jgi:CelD/BcsL family acetyltransferase involved in cellulose biosynthesis